MCITWLLQAAAREAEHFKACQQPEAPVTPSQPARNGFNRLRQAVNEAMARPQVPPPWPPWFFLQIASLRVSGAAFPLA